MGTFYATALSKKGESKIIVNLDIDRVIAEKQAKFECAKQNLIFQEIRVVKGTTYNGEPTSKTLFKRIAKERAKAKTAKKTS
jgi:hypothetical protein